MPLDPVVKAMMDEMAEAPGPPLHTLPPEEARRVTAEMFQGMMKEGPWRRSRIARFRARPARPRCAFTLLLARVPFQFWGIIYLANPVCLGVWT